MVGVLAYYVFIVWVAKVAVGEALGKPGSSADDFTSAHLKIWELRVSHFFPLSVCSRMYFDLVFIRFWFYG